MVYMTDYENGGFYLNTCFLHKNTCLKMEFFYLIINKGMLLAIMYVYVLQSVRSLV